MSNNNSQSVRHDCMRMKFPDNYNFSTDKGKKGANQFVTGEAQGKLACQQYFCMCGVFQYKQASIGKREGIGDLCQLSLGSLRKGKPLEENCLSYSLYFPYQSIKLFLFCYCHSRYLTDMDLYFYTNNCYFETAIKFSLHSKQNILKQCTTQVFVVSENIFR